MKNSYFFGMCCEEFTSQEGALLMFPPHCLVLAPLMVSHCSVSLKLLRNKCFAQRAFTSLFLSRLFWSIN